MSSTRKTLELRVSANDSREAAEVAEAAEAAEAAGAAEGAAAEAAEAVAVEVAAVVGHGDIVASARLELC
jgi:hypothetical protein